MHPTAFGMEAGTGMAPPRSRLHAWMRLSPCFSSSTTRGNESSPRDISPSLAYRREAKEAARFPIAAECHEIRKWAEARGGKPATVKRTESKNEAGVLRIDFRGYSGSHSLEEISWDEFFKKFDEKHLAFLYQDKTSSGEQSRFFKLVSQETASNKSTQRGH